MQRIQGRKADILAWTNPGEIEGVALEQLKNISSLPWVFHHVAAMADVHYGKGATVGSVIAMKGAVSPAAVGVDVGCGVGVVKCSLTARDLPDDRRPGLDGAPFRQPPYRQVAGGDPHPAGQEARAQPGPSRPRPGRLPRRHQGDEGLPARPLLGAALRDEEPRGDAGPVRLRA